MMAQLSTFEPGDDNPHPTDDGPKYPDPDKRTGVARDPDEPPTPPPWEGPRLAFSILLQPCGVCGAAIPVRGPRACEVCLSAGACPVCAVRHGPAMCPEVRAVWDEEDAKERHSQAVDRALALNLARIRPAMTAVAVDPTCGF